MPILLSSACVYTKVTVDRTQHHLLPSLRGNGLSPMSGLNQRGNRIKFMRLKTLQKQKISSNEE
jgi:hypothetical protein